MSGLSDSLSLQVILFNFIGAFVLFLYGISRTTGGLQRISGARIRPLFSGFVKNRIYGGFIGCCVSAITQSSTATAIMAVGFVNAGLIPVITGISVILGANVGASLTFQLVTLHPTIFLLPALGLGAIFRFIFRNHNYRAIGDVLIGLALLMLGLILMTEAVKPLRESDAIRNVIQIVGDKFWLCVLASATMAAIVQSSTALIATTIAFASAGLITFQAGVALMLGANIGACTAPIIASVGANLGARRAASAQLLLNLLGTLVVFLMFPLFLGMVEFVSPGQADFVVQSAADAQWFNAALGSKPLISRHIANAYTLYTIICVVLFFPFLSSVAKIVSLIIRGVDTRQEMNLKFIDYRVLNTPPIALGQARSEVRRMAHLAHEALAETINCLHDVDQVKIEMLAKREMTLDLLQKEITNFLALLSHRSSSPEILREIAKLIHTVGDLERIGDHCQTLVRLSQRKQEWRVVFSDVAEQELQLMSSKTLNFLKFMVDAVDANGNDAVQIAESYENEIDRLEEDFRNNHINRLSTGECAVRPGLIFIDMLQAFEKISDHTLSVAKYIAGED